MRQPTSAPSIVRSGVGRALVVALALTLAATACGGDGGDAAVDDTTPTADQTGQSDDPGSAAASGIRVVSAAEGAAIQADPPADLVILDVRTAEEFADGHLDGAVMLDFYREDFADRLAELDPDQPYLVYCRSGNRSGQTRALMEQLGFTDVADVDGGILAWTDAGLPTATG